MESFIKICIIAGFFQFAACCDSGRIFIGSINETYPEVVDRNGIYIQQSEQVNGLPSYKHETRDYYLYHVSGNLISPFWVIGSSPGSLSGTLNVQTPALSVDEATENWKIWSSTHHSWVEERHIRAACVDESFVTCSTGRLHLHGLSPWNHHQLNRTGYYYLTNTTYDMRPVYQDEHQIDYLFYVDGLWMVGPEVGRVSAGLFVLDYAWRPEYIIESWIVFNGRQFLRDPRLTVRCAGNSATTALSQVSSNHGATDEAIDVGDILTIAEELDNDEGALGCADHICENGGTCIMNEVGNFLCACPEFYSGDRCEKIVECADPPDIEHGQMVSKTGNGFRALAFYSCDQEFVIQGRSPIECQHNGEWSEAPTCVSWLDHVSPGVEPNETRKRRQYFMNLGRRHRNHHRQARSLLPVDLEKMKSLFQ